MSNDRVKNPKLPASFLGLLISVLGYLGDSAIRSNKESLEKLEKAYTNLKSEVDIISVRDAARAESTTHINTRIAFFEKVTEDREQRLSSVESDLKSLSARILRIEEHEDKQQRR